MARGIAALLMASLASAAPLRAEDWYVDARAGSDANDGQSPASAWRTITHALDAIPAAPVVEHALHVAPGVYDQALGELFPLRPPPLLRIVGSAGSAQTVLDAGGAFLLIYAGDDTQLFDVRSGAEGLTLRNGTSGVVVTASQGEARPAFRELAIERMSVDGIYVHPTPASLEFASARPSFEQVEISHCARGVYVRASAGGLEAAHAGITLTRVTIRGSTGDGVRVSAEGEAGARATLHRCRIVENGANGVSSYAAGDKTSALLEAYASLFARNRGAGVRGETPGVHGVGNSRLIDCTLAHNAGAGAQAIGEHALIFTNSILAGNGDDLVADSPAYAIWSCCADGELRGLPNCITADPLFVDPTVGDFRLTFGSPCVETGDPDASGELDLLGHARPYDGDLDTQAANDMGAFELEPLHVDGGPSLGSILRFEFWGASGSQSRLMLARLPLIDPLVTPYGTLYLERSELVVLGTIGLSTSPSVLERALPRDPALIGTTLSFQALTTSTAAPLGAALTNPISFVVEP